MSHLRSFWRVLKTLTMAAVCWAAVYGSALAKKPAVPEEEGGEGGAAAWTMPYGLVILGVALGMLLVCRSSRRRERARPESYDEGKLTKEMKE